MRRLKAVFDSYYKYVFHFDVLDEDGKKIGEFMWGGDKDEIYRLNVEREMWLDDFLFEDDIEEFLNGKEFDLWGDGFGLYHVKE